MPGNWTRLGYVSEFLLAIIAVFTLWSQAGGQGHLDMIPWHWKLGLGMGASWAVVKATAAAAGHEKPWNRQTLLWLALAAALGVCMGLLVYRYHLLEPVDEDQEMIEEEAAAPVRTPSGFRGGEPPRL